MKRVLLVTVAGAALAAGSALWARAEGDEGPGGRGRRPFDVGRMQSELGLSDDQVAQLQKLRSDGRTQGIRQRADLRIAQGELHDLLRAPSVDEKAVSAKVKQVTDLQASATRARVEHQLALRRILTPDQIEKLQALRKDRMGEGRGLRRGFRGHRRGGEPAPAGPGADQ